MSEENKELKNEIDILTESRESFKTIYEEINLENEHLTNELQALRSMYNTESKIHIENLKENEILKSENGCLKYNFNMAMNEIKNLKAIIAEELNENDEFGKEFVIYTILKDEIELLKRKLEKAINTLNYFANDQIYKDCSVNGLEMEIAVITNGLFIAQNALKEIEELK